jgi:NADPH:quinone reductase-like Zn-dependent oxidoreductase
VPAAGEILVRVHAAGVTLTELLWSPTTHTRDGGRRTLAVPGHEFSGVVAAVGPAAADAPGAAVAQAVGQAVFGTNDWFTDGATAEFCLARPEHVAPKPSRLSHAQAASVPIGALTAWQGLFDRAKLRAGERVLIHGGAGAVGVFAIQLARRHGARVITTASARHADFLKGIGAEQVIDYRTGRFEDLARDVDAIFDAVGGDTLRRSWAVLRPGGRLVTIAADGEGTSDDRTKQAYFIVEPNRAQLTEIGRLLESGELVPFVDAVVPFDQAPDAYAGRARRDRGVGKVVISVVPDPPV